MGIILIAYAALAIQNHADKWYIRGKQEGIKIEKKRQELNLK
jgi:hypothetical protein